MVATDCRVLGNGAFLLSPKENCSYSKPSRSTPTFTRGVNTNRSSVSLSSKSSTSFDTRATAASPTYVSSKEYSRGQKSVPNEVVASKVATSNCGVKERAITTQRPRSCRKR